MTHGAPSSKKNAENDTNAVKPPDGGWGWVVVFGSFMIHIVADGLTYTLGIFLVEFMNYFNAGSESTSWIASILVGVTLGSGPIVSALVNKYGCRAITIAGAIVAAIGLGISSFAQDVTTLYITIGVVTGFGFGLIYLPAIVSVTCYFELKRSFATGIAVCGSGLGTFIFAPLVEILITMFFWRGALLVVAAITLNCVVFGALFRPLEPTPAQSENKRIRQPDENDPLADKSEKERLMVIAEEVVNENGSPKKSEIVSSNTSTAMLSRSSHNVSAVSDTAPKTAGNGVQQDTVTLSVAVGDMGIARMTKSQPHLLMVPEVPASAHSRKYGSHGVLPTNNQLQNGNHDPETGRASNKSSTNELRNRSGSGAMYRKDALYNMSVTNLPEYQADPKRFTASMTRIPQNDPVELSLSKKKVNVCGCIPCEKESYDAYKEMMDFSLFKDPVFILFTLSNFCTSIGFNVPYVYIKDKALDLNIKSEDASFLLAIIGIANTVGRIVLGYISDKPWLNRLWLYNVALTICGLATAFSAYCLDYVSLAVYCAIFGVTAGAYVGLTSVIVVDLLGLDKLTNAFGLLLLFQGIASLIGPPIAGRLKDQLGSYDPGFFMAGSMIAASGLMLFFIPCLKRVQKK